MAAGSTYTPIATTTLGSAAASYTFSSIPSTYTDLVLISNFQTNTGSVTTYQMYFNGGSSGAYSYTRIYGDGTNASSSNANTTTNIQGIGIIDPSAWNTNIANVMNYANSTTNKTVLARTNSSGTYLGAYVMKWNQNTAITSLTVNILSGASFSTGATFTLYGIAAA
jgi:hypothetical protein